MPFTVVLGLNSPTHQRDNPGIADTLTAVERAQERYPHLDVRKAMTYYDEPTIGMIRRDLWNAVLLQSVHEGAYDTPQGNEVIAINHDIGTVQLTPRYMSRIQHYYNKKQTRYAASGLGGVVMPIATSVTRHAFDPDHPHSSLGAKWVDYGTTLTNGWYEAGMIVPMSRYAELGGFHAADKTSETLPLAVDAPRLHRVPGTLYYTSPRRYVDRLRYGFDTIWSPDTFGAEDACRTAPEHADISLERLQLLMVGSESLHAAIRYSAQLQLVRHLNGLGENIGRLSTNEYMREVVAPSVNQIGKIALVASRDFELYDCGYHIYGLSKDMEFMRSVTSIALNIQNGDE